MDYYKIDERIHSIPKKTLSWAEKCFYGRLAFRCNHKNKSWWSNERLAADFQSTPRLIQMWTRNLENLGLITVHRRTGSSNEISINELTDDLVAELGGEKNFMGGMKNSSWGGEENFTPSRKRKLKGKGKTVDGSAVGRATLDELWGDSDVNAAGKRAAEKSRKREQRAVPTVESVAVPPEEDSLPEESRLARWSKAQWSSAFVKEMRARGFQVSLYKYKAFQEHVGSIRDHLLNRGFSRLKIYRFLLVWFPEAYGDLRCDVFRKRSDDLMFSVTWMEPRLDELVRLFEEGSKERPEGGPEVIVVD
jgi:hypothetical protein